MLVEDSAEIVRAKDALFNGLGNCKRIVATGSPEAKRYFNQGLVFYHGF